MACMFNIHTYGHDVNVTCSLFCIESAGVSQMLLNVFLHVGVKKRSFMLHLRGLYKPQSKEIYRWMHRKVTRNSLELT